MGDKLTMLVFLLFNLLNMAYFFIGFIPLRSGNKNITNIQFSRNVSLSTEGFDRTVFMVVDALRLDFVSNKYMPLTSNLIEKYGCLIDVRVESPTVTLPRIKALTTGSVPQFVDIFHNLGNPRYVDDSLLHRAQKQNKKIVFYGDDTWLKIFPNMFLRQDGTSSFFVTDFHEVDDNVTRHVNAELSREDWNIMILHYLGLDHIGHVHGPFSSLVPPKLQEMDQVFFKLAQETFKMKGKTLLLLTGDHGMKDSGGHGGSTYSEVHVPLVVLGTSCENGSMDQIDIAANIAALLNLEIPSASIGILNRSFLNNFTLDQYLHVLEYNSLILRNKHGACDKKFDLASKLYKMYLDSGEVSVASKAVELFEECSKELSQALIKSSVDQNFLSMIVSVIFIIFLFTIALNNFQFFAQRNNAYLFFISLSLMRLFLHQYFSFCVGVCVSSIYLLKVLNTRTIFEKYKSMTGATLLPLLVQPLTWLSSSFIEEEHEYWYFFLNCVFVFHLAKHVKQKNYNIFLSWLLISISFRFAQTLNQTGDKWASLPDTSDYLMKPENSFFHFILLTISIFFIYFGTFRNYNNPNYSLLDILILILIYLFKSEIFNQPFLARIIYILIFFSFIINKSYLHFWILVISLLSKSYNLCLIPLCIYTSREISREYGMSTYSIITHLMLGRSLFFIQGNGNSLANIDISVGYIGLNTYFPFLVGFQVVINVYSLIILVHLLLIQASSQERDKVLRIFFLERLYSTIVTCFVVIIFRNHISVWTIYAPKLVIEFCHTFIFFIEIIIYQLFFHFHGKVNKALTTCVQ